MVYAFIESGIINQTHVFPPQNIDLLLQYKISSGEMGLMIGTLKGSKHLNPVFFLGVWQDCAHQLAQAMLKYAALA